MVERSGSHRPPDFLIVGGQRCGTASLFDALMAHPLVVPPTRREVHYFDLRHWRGRRWYHRQFVRPVGTRSGESSPYYLFHPRVPERVARHLPGVPIVALVRDPIDRAWSHHQHNRRNGREELDFLDALAAEPERLAAAGVPRRDRFLLPHRDHSYATRGRYVGQLDRWAASVGRGSMLVVASAQLYASPAEVHRRVLEHLGLPTEPLPTPHRHRSGERLTPEVRRAAGRFFSWVDGEEAELRRRYGVGFSRPA